MVNEKFNLLFRVSVGNFACSCDVGEGASGGVVGASLFVRFLLAFVFVSRSLCHSENHKKAQAIKSPTVMSLFKHVAPNPLEEDYFSFRSPIILHLFIALDPKAYRSDG